jgi:hypothetical protein
MRNQELGLENRDCGLRDPSRWPRGTLFQQKLALTSLKSCCRSVGIVRPRTHATEFSYKRRLSSVAFSSLSFLWYLLLFPNFCILSSRLLDGEQVIIRFCPPQELVFYLKECLKVITGVLSFRRKLKGDWILVMLAIIRFRAFRLLVCCQKT